MAAKRSEHKLIPDDHTPDDASANSSTSPSAADDHADASALLEELGRAKAELEQQREMAEQNLQGWQRAQADLANYRRRQEQERVELLKFVELRLILDILPALDDLERAWQSLPSDIAESQWIGGLRLIDHKLRGALATHGLTPIEAVGKAFDPHTHEAVLTEDGDPSTLTLVVEEFRKGYTLHERVIRPSLVKVGKGASRRVGGKAYPE